MVGIFTKPELKVDLDAQAGEALVRSCEKGKREAAEMLIERGSFSVSFSGI
jgi:hypothetical protein